MRVGSYEIKGTIGEGATGVVYRARHTTGEKSVALKVLHDQCARMKDAVEQLTTESKATSRLRHPNLTDVTDVGTTPEGRIFLAMEYLDGESLRDRLRQVQRIPLFEAINIMRQVARGLGAAHEAGIIHAGLKPSSIFLCKRDGRRRIVRRSKAKGMRLVVEAEESFDLVKLLDFGMAGFLDLSLGTQTPAGAVCGMPHYLSPEQAQMQPADQRSDIYGLGAIFYEMITGSIPFGGESLADILRGQASGLVIAPGRRTPGAGIDGRMDSLILRCLKKNPVLRFATTGELCAALDACVTDCAFLRDAHRLPGIAESGIDLSEASAQARQDGEHAAKKTAAAPVATKATLAPAATKPAPVPVPRQPVPAPVEEKPAEILAAAKPVAAAIVETAVPTPALRAPVVAPMTDDPAAAIVTPPPVLLAPADDPAAAVLTPPPTLAPMADDPSAAIITPPPEVVAADLPAELPDGFVARPSRKSMTLPEALISNLDERPERLRRDAEDRPGKARPAGSHRPRVFALAGVLLLGAGLAVWATRSGSEQNTTMPVAVAPAAPTAPAPTPPPPPPPPAAAEPVAAPAAPAAPAAAAPVAAPAEPAAPAAAAPSAAPPEPEPAAPAKTTKAAIGGPGKLASTPTRPAQAKRARRTAPTIPVPAETETGPAAAVETTPAPAPAAEPETAPALAAKTEPQPEAKPKAPSAAPAEPEPAAPAAKPADAFVREAQQAWMRGHYAAAIGKAESALKSEPSRAQTAQAYEIIGISSCSLGDAAAAREAASHLSEMKRAVVKAVCQKNAVTLE